MQKVKQVDWWSYRVLKEKKSGLKLQSEVFYERERKKKTSLLHYLSCGKYQFDMISPVPNHELSGCFLKFLSWTSGLENVPSLKKIFFNSLRLAVMSKILSYLGWVLQKKKKNVAIWITLSLESLCQRFQVPSNDLDKSCFLNKLAFFSSTLFVDWTHSWDSFPWQADLWVRAVWGHICSQDWAWNPAFLPPTHKAWMRPPHGLWEFSPWWLKERTAAAWNSHLSPGDKVWSWI